jgi:hypothetical protein
MINGVVPVQPATDKVSAIVAIARGMFYGRGSHYRVGQ